MLSFASVESLGRVRQESLCAKRLKILMRYDMNGRAQMQGCKNRILPKEMNANGFFRDSHSLEIWKNHFCPSMGPNGGSVACECGYGLRLSEYTQCGAGAR